MLISAPYSSNKSIFNFFSKLNSKMNRCITCYAGLYIDVRSFRY
ncbi:CRPV-067 [Crowpox virus]|nr:CRPV-067 [Crowpox virus]